MLDTTPHLHETTSQTRKALAEEQGGTGVHGVAPASKHLQAVERAVAYLREHLASPLTLDDVAAAVAMSKFHFARVFEQLTGTPPRCFLACLRIEQAKRILHSTDIPVTDVCLEVGYASLGTFSQAFSDIVGVSPSAYRRVSKEAVDPLDFVGRCTSFLANQRGEIPGDLTGIIESPVDTEASVIFVGAFARGAPLGRPQSGTVLLRDGKFRIRRPAAANFHLLAVRLPIRGLVNVANTTLEVSGVASHRFPASHSAQDGSACLRLRAPTSIDPPLLVEFSALI